MKDVHSGAARRLLPLIAVLGFGVAGVGASHAAVTLNTIKITSDGVERNCTLNSFTVNGGALSVGVSGCNPALGSDNGGGGNDGGGNDGGGNDGGGNDGGGNDGGGNDGGGNDGGSGGTDPGTGSWSPDLNATPRVVVVNQSGGAGATVTVVPGCVNGGSVQTEAFCSTQSTYNTSVGGTPVAVQLTKGQILSVRYPVASGTKGSSTGKLELANAIGGNIGVNTRISLSPTPGDMTGGGKSRCVSTSTAKPSVSTGTGGFSCVIDRSKSMYYLNIEVQQACSGSSCIFYINETSTEFN